jgi:hypothetical protein
MRRMTALCSALAIVSGFGLVACGDDDGGGGGGQAMSTEEFCELLRESEADPSDDASFEALDELVAAAPPEIRDDLELVRDRLQQLEGLDEDDPAAFEAVMELMGDPEFVAASERLEEFGVEECGMEPSDTGTTLGAVDEGDDA